jgi:hypothetical protein
VGESLGRNHVSEVVLEAVSTNTNRSLRERCTLTK